MIAVAWLLLQVTVAGATAGAVDSLTATLDAPVSIAIRGQVRPIPVTFIAGEPAVRADQLIPAIGGTLSRSSTGAVAIGLPGVSLEMVDGLPWMRSERGVMPLTAAPHYVDGVFWLPLSFVSDAMPRLATGILYDPQRAEIRLFGLLGDNGASEGRRAPARQRPSASRAGATGASTAVATATAGARSAPLPPSGGATKLRTSHTVIVDAGHGGIDRGMKGPWGCRDGLCLREADITLQVAEELRDALRARGVKVVMTRTADTLIALGDRGRIANAAKGDLFLSIHVNAANPRWNNPGGARGYETYFLSEAKTEDERRVAQMENESIKFETEADAPKGDDLSFLLNDMAQNEHLRESNALAELVQQGLSRIHPGPSRGTKQAGFRVLVTAFMPAVLIEIGFGTNPNDARWMSDADTQRRLAGTIADAAMEYLSRYERKVMGS